MKNRQDANNGSHFYRHHFYKVLRWKDRLPPYQRHGTITNINQVIRNQKRFINLLTKIQMIGNEFGYEDISIAVTDLPYHHDDKYDNRYKDGISEYIVIHNQILNYTTFRKKWKYRLKK